MLQFILERYNYWIVIILMMMGLYIVFSRGNLVKKIIGLNIFQTSVFIFYITIGKIAGGTAPIFIGGHGGGHGEEHGADNGSDHDGADLSEGADPHEAVSGMAAQDVAQNHASATSDGLNAHSANESLHSKVSNSVNEALANKSLIAGEKALGQTGSTGQSGLHSLPEGADANRLADKINNSVADGAKSVLQQSETLSLDIDHAGEAAIGNAANSPVAAPPQQTGHSNEAHGDVAHGVAEVIYTNPLPHVLILTAIVVGVATTAVGLALAVRIREAYGTIEEDELEAIDDIAEFGKAQSLTTAQSAAQTGGAR